MQATVATAPPPGGSAAAHLGTTAPVGNGHGFRLALDAVQAVSQPPAATTRAPAIKDVPQPPSAPRAAGPQQPGGEPAPVVIANAGSTIAPRRARADLKAETKAADKAESEQDAKGSAPPSDNAAPAIDPVKSLAPPAGPNELPTAASFVAVPTTSASPDFGSAGSTSPGTAPSGPATSTSAASFAAVLTAPASLNAGAAGSASPAPASPDPATSGASGHAAMAAAGRAPAGVPTSPPSLAAVPAATPAATAASPRSPNVPPPFAGPDAEPPVTAERKPAPQAPSAATDKPTPVPNDPSLDTVASATILPPQPATPTAVPVTAPTSPSVASPAQQVAPALIAVTQGHDGAQRMTLRLNPAELGMVQVQIERAASGPTRVEITAERAGTLEMLQLDQPQLHHALDQAGVPSQGRTITFHVAPAPQPAIPPPGASQSGGNPSDRNPSGGNASAGGGQGGASGSSGHAGGGGGSAGYAAREQTSHAGTRRTSTLSSETPQQSETTPVKWLRAGLNITA